MKENKMKRLLILMALMASSCSAIADDFNSSQNTNSANRQVTDTQIDSLVNVYSPLKSGKVPKDIESRLGVTHMGGKYHLTGDPFIVEGSKKIQELGFTTAMYFLGIVDPKNNLKGYTYNSDWKLQKSASFVEILSHPYFVKALDCGQKCVVFNAGAFKDKKLSSEVYQDIYQMSKYLLTTYKDRDITFIIKNWEGDWMMRGEGVSKEVWMARKDNERNEIVKNMTEWFRIRQEAVTDARNKVTQTRAKIFFAIEANKVIEGMNGAVTTIANDILPNVSVDMVSWSSYDGMSNHRTFYRGIEYLRRQHRPTPYMAGKKSVMIGEIGIQERTFKKDIKQTWDSLFGVIFALDVPLVVNWELYCNELAENVTNDYNRVYKEEELRGLWILKPDGTRSTTGDYWQSMLKMK